MMKKLFILNPKCAKLFSLLLFALTSSLFTLCNAQYVTIPDAKFVTYLHKVVPSAMRGNQMDTTNATVLRLGYIYIENSGIKDLTGVQYFKSLITLDCGNGSPSLDSNHITRLPNLPGTLDTLICGNNQIDSLPALPSGLIDLECYINELKNLPTLPSTLIYLDCWGNQLTNLPVLPATLLYLDCTDNFITILPILPGSLQELGCANNLLTNLPVLPATLQGLDCGINQISTIPILPGSLQDLGCYTNLLSVLPTLPNTLQSLQCGENQLTTLPTLPPNLLYLSCAFNHLTTLPALPITDTLLICSYNYLTSLPPLPPKLNFLWCDSNKISCFPVFPNTLKLQEQFTIIPNPFNCLPNYVPAMDNTSLLYPLCMPGNSNGCPVTPGVVGFTYEDLDANCIKDTGDKVLTNIPVQFYSTGNVLLSQTYTAINGVYDFPSSAGNYRVHIDTIGMPFIAQCTYPGIDSNVSFALIDTNVNFSLICKSGFDVGVQSVVTNGLIFPGVQHAVKVIAGDLSQWYNLARAKGDSGTVQIDVTGPVTYIGPGAGALTPNVVSGNMFTYHIPDYGAINNTTAFDLIFHTDTTAQASDTICVSITVTPLADNNPSNNTYQYCYYVINSHDPNRKDVYPVDVAPGYDNWFTYTIHFQNTGSAPAKNILIKDILDSRLDINTFQLLNYSSRNTTKLSGRSLTFQFENINLPDSTVSPKGSTGFVQYRIKPKTGLPKGSVIRNTGFIYFDFNPAIITNTTENIFTAPASTESATSITYITTTVFPNPSRGVFSITLPNGNGPGMCTISIFNVLEQEVYHATLNPDNTQIDLTARGAGVYFYTIKNDSGVLVSHGKIIAE